MRALIISPSLEEPNGRGLHSITNNIIESLHGSGYEVGVLSGLPHHKEIEGSELIESKINHVFLQHYFAEGRSSFKYVNKGGYSRLNAAKAVLNGSIYDSRFIDVDKDLLTDGSGQMHSFDYVVQSPFFYQFLNRNHEKRIKKSIKKICNSFDIDIIIITSPSLIYTQWLKNTKTVQFVHDFMPVEVLETPPDNDTPVLFGAQATAACFGSDLLLTNSKDTQGKILEINPEANTSVLYGAVETPKSSLSTETLAEFKLQEDKFLVFASALEKRKNLENIMDAYALASNKIERMPLVIIGGPGYGFEAIYEKYLSLPDDIQSHIIFTGYLPKAKKDALFINARACVFTTLYEGLGLPVVEALAAGTPVVTAKVGALPEAGMDAALYINNPRSIEEISQGIVTIVNDDKVRAELMKNAPKVVRFFSSEKFNNRLHDALTAVTKGDTK